MAGHASHQRGQWSSTLGFVLAASGSAIGLGNIVFFGANAYKYGGGAFYVPYFIALFLVGIPVMMLEFGIGRQMQRAFPIALRKMAGAPGEFIGWWALFNASIITMYYITLLAWVLGMLVGSFGPLWRASYPTPGFVPGSLPNPTGYFFHTLASPVALVYVALMWIANILICSKGARSIEASVKFFVPAMWVMMIVLIVRGVTLPGGTDGVLYLFNPDFRIMNEFSVWRGAFGQIFFSLSLGFGIMSAYASYLPKRANTDHYAVQTSLLNCSFEYVAGFAIFSMLFAFAIVPKASTLAMSFFVLPAGIARLPGAVGLFGVLFFLLLLFAGVSSSISLIEGMVAALLDKFRVRRRTVLTVVLLVGFAGSAMFALPRIIDPGLAGDGTLGLTLLDLFDNKAFGYGLLMVGLAECVLVGWFYGVQRLRGRARDGAGGRARVFPALVAIVIPVTLGILLVSAVWDEVHQGLFGRALVAPSAIGGNGAWRWLPVAAPLAWGIFTVAGAAILTALRGSED